MTSNSQFTGLTPKQVEFCDQFPDGRLCRFINRRSGTLLDVRPNLTLVDDEVPQVVGKFIPRPSLEPGNAETFGVQYWIIKPHGDGQAIIPVPKDGSNTVMYLTASGFVITVAVTVSPFPVSWVIIPTSDSPTSPPLTGSTVPPGLTEEWTAQICWPHSNNNVPRLLDLRFSIHTARRSSSFGASNSSSTNLLPIETGLSAYCCLIDWPNQAFLEFGFAGAGTSDTGPASVSSVHRPETGIYCTSAWVETKESGWERWSGSESRRRNRLSILFSSIIRDSDGPVGGTARQGQIDALCLDSRALTSPDKDVRASGHRQTARDVVLRSAPRGKNVHARGAESNVVKELRDSVDRRGVGRVGAARPERTGARIGQRAVSDACGREEGRSRIRWKGADCGGRLNRGAAR
ncbi:hypothetical protein B0H13DRAFT_1877205 [Mycena leptocephala]|nr:hypothetical protein B0H13DRAFT_1877205 [Mycena leptocephala]